MTRLRRGPARPAHGLSQALVCASALLAALFGALWHAPVAEAAPWYDDGGGNGCISCHTGFENGTGILHFQHLNNFGPTTCNVCHTSGGGSVPVLTYSSGPGGGLGCAGCHGRDYGETSPNSGNPKSTAYALRDIHVANGVASCGLSGGCHVPGQLGHPATFPSVFPENVAPVYYNVLFSALTDPCSAAQEDIPADADADGLDNDGDGDKDYPADLDCPMPTPTPAFECGAAPAVGCIAPGKGVVVVSEKAAGKEKLKVVMTKLQAAVTPADFGDPVDGDTAYKVCIYDDADVLAGEYTVDEAGNTCDGAPCFKEISGKGFKYKDKTTTADGVLKMNLFGGDPGKGKIVVVAKNKAATMPTGTAAALLSQPSATVQVITSDASCFGGSYGTVKKADGSLFKALTP